MDCLNERLTDLRALTDVFAVADGKVVENAVASAGSLGGVERCRDVSLLRAVIKPPADESTRARVEALRSQLAHVKAIWQAGRCAQAQPVAKDLLGQVRALDYRPLLAETLLALGSEGENCAPAPERIGWLQEAFAVALGSRHDEAAARAASFLPAFYADRMHQPSLGRQWLEIARAAVMRAGGNPGVVATLDSSEATVLRIRGPLRTGVRRRAARAARAGEAAGPGPPLHHLLRQPGRSGVADGRPLGPGAGARDGGA